MTATNDSLNAALNPRDGRALLNSYDDAQTFYQQLENELVPKWEHLMSTRIFRALMGDEPVGVELLQLYLIESYHYVKHNAQHQALAVWQKDVRDRDFMRAALRHALEEVDHDQMALRDLERMGIERERVIRSEPLAETMGFTGYLYYLVTRDNPVGRLGYSIWAEGTQKMGPVLINRIKNKYGIADDKKISFFAAHATLDMKHGEECRRSIERFARTPEDQYAVRVAAHTTLKLFINVLEAVYDRYLEVKAGASLLRELPAEVGVNSSGFRL